MVQQMSLEKLALAVLLPMTGWVMITVHTLSVDVAVLHERALVSVSPATFAAFVARVEGQEKRNNQWLARLSDRLKHLERQIQ